MNSQAEHKPYVTPGLLLKTRMNSTMSCVQEPNGIEEEAVLLVERSKESRNPAIKRDLLARCAKGRSKEGQKKPV